MIPARKTRLFNWWFSRHAEKRLRASFQSVHVRGLEGFRAVTRESPVLLVSNHTSWWDPMAMIFLLPRHLGLDPYAMMDERNLRKLPFFSRVGAFGVDLRGGAAAESLRYAEALLSRPGRVVLIYPQGRERASSVRPLGFRRGSAVVASRVPHVPVVPLGVRYEVAGSERPGLFLSFGEPLPRARDVQEGRALQEAAVESELDRLDRRVIRLRDGETDALSGFETVLEHRGSRAQRMATAALAWLTRRASRPRAVPSDPTEGPAPPSARDEV